MVSRSSVILDELNSIFSRMTRGRGAPCRYSRAGLFSWLLKKGAPMRFRLAPRALEVLLQLLDALLLGLKLGLEGLHLFAIDPSSFETGNSSRLVFRQPGERIRKSLWLLQSAVNILENGSSLISCCNVTRLYK